MPLLPQDKTESDGLSLLYWTIMGPHGANRAVQRLEFRDCRKGLGVKIIGGHREQSGEQFGIYVKRVVSGGLAALDGRLKSGDLILDVNNVSLVGATNERAVEILRMASLSNHMSLLIARDEESRTQFLELMEKCSSSNSSLPGQISPSQLNTVRLIDTASSSSSSRSESPQLLSPKDGLTTHGHAPSHAANSPQSLPPPSRVFSDSIIQLICVSKATGLGLVIKGGANRADGPMVFIQELMAGGDCQKDGRLQAGDQLVSVNKESLIGVTYEEARSILTRTKLRPDPTVEIAFIRRSLWSGSSRGSPSSQAPAGAATRPLVASAAALQPGAVSKTASAEQNVSETTAAVNVSQVRVHAVGAEQNPSSPPGDNAVTLSGCEAAGGQPQPSRRLKLNHLDQALDVFGLKPSEAQQQAIRSRLKADPAGTVAFTDFQILIREMFESQLDELDVTGSRSRLLGLMDSPGNRQRTSQLDSEDLEEMEQLRKEHIEALREMKRLQEQLVESQRVQHQMEEELNKVKQDMELLRTEESQALTTQIQLAEEAQKQARGMEMDYEEVIHLLEAEIAELKSQRVEPSLLTNKEDRDELKKKIAILECQLRKSEAARKRFEASAGKLLSFVEDVQEFLQENHGPPKSYSSGDLKGGAPPLAPPYKKGQWTLASLAQEAKELSRTVRSVMEVDCLPYGSEEAYTAEGVKYYINHVTQTTSWSLDVPGDTIATGPWRPLEADLDEDWEEEENKPGSAVETDM